MSSIQGYRELSDCEIALINQIKDQAERTRELLDSLSVSAVYDQRWIGIARTELQQGYMALVRAVARPQGF